jgi:hypothetical protein
MYLSPAPALFSAARGMSDAARLMDTGAADVADISTDPTADGPTDLVSALVDATVLAPLAYTANATVARTAAETEGALFDVRA